MIGASRFCRRHPDVEGRLLVFSSKVLGSDVFECPACVLELENAIWAGFTARHIAPGGEERELEGRVVRIPLATGAGYVSEGGTFPVPKPLELVGIETYVARYRIQKTPRVAALIQERDGDRAWFHLAPEWPEDFRRIAPQQGIA